MNNNVLMFAPMSTFHTCCDDVSKILPCILLALSSNSLSIYGTCASYVVVLKSSEVVTLQTDVLLR